MTSARRTSLLAGGLYLLTVVTSVAALALKQPVLKRPELAGSGTALPTAALLEVVLAVACIGTAVVLYPIARRVNETAALGFVAARVLEAGVILVGVIAMLSLPAASAGDGGAALVAVHDQAFLLGPGLIPAVNAGCLGYVMYRSKLVPRIIPVIGFVGAPLLVLSATATLFGLTSQVSAVSGLAALPVAIWEISLGCWLVVRGFRPARVPDEDVPAAPAIALPTG